MSSVVCDASITAPLCYKMYKQVKLVQVILVIISENEQNMGNIKMLNVKPPVVLSDILTWEIPRKQMKQTTGIGNP